jgi:hypothetical protein
MKSTTERVQGESDQRPCTAFAGTKQIASGELAEVALKAKRAIDRGRPVLVFDDSTGEVIDLDFRAIPPAAPAHPDTDAPRGPGRPKLGVVGHEVTLLPRHWEWLNSQPGGASVALRKLVEEARRANAEKDGIRLAQEAAYRFMSAMAGNEPGYEEALRALFGGKREGFEVRMAAWPADVREYARKLAEGAFPRGSASK